MERGLTQGQLAKMVGCYANDISGWEKGLHRPGSAALIKLAAALNCTIDEIIK